MEAHRDAAGRAATVSGLRWMAPRGHDLRARLGAVEAMSLVDRYLSYAYALLVAGVAFVWPPLAIIVAALYLVALAVVADRRRAPAPEVTE